MSSVETSLFELVNSFTFCDNRLNWIIFPCVNIKYQLPSTSRAGLSVKPEYAFLSMFSFSFLSFVCHKIAVWSSVDQTSQVLELSKRLNV